MTDAAFFEAAMPATVRIAGIRLLPLTLGHRLLLQRMDCAFATGGPVTFSDLFVALAILSRSHRAGRGFIEPRFADRLRLRWLGLRLWLVVRLGYNLAAAAHKLGDYIAAQSAMPAFRYHTENGKAKPIRAPADAVLKVSLQENLGYSAADALDLPYRQALFEHLISSARQGNIELVDDEWAELHERYSITPQDEIDAMIATHERLRGGRR